MRSMIMGIIDISKANRESLREILGEGRVNELALASSNEISLLAKSFNEITSRLEQNVRNLELAKKTLHSVLSRVGEGLSSMENIDSFLDLILETVTEAMQAETGFLLIKAKNSDDYIVKSVFGQKSIQQKGLRVKADDPLLEQMLKSKLSLIYDRIPRDGLLGSLLYPPMIVAPLVLHDEILGFIAVSGRKSEQPYTEEESNLLSNIGLQTAVAIENSKLNEDAERTYFETISALALAVEAKDPYSRGHLDRVSRLVTRMGRDLNLSTEEINTLRDAAKLHDLGKIGVTDKVLAKAGPLTAQEMDMMKKHCEIGEGIIKPIRSLRRLCDIVRHHHEKLDGTGYPDGLKGDDVHVLVRVLTVADIFDALTTNRPYREAHSRDKALEILRGMKDQVDQKIVEILAKIV